MTTSARLTRFGEDVKDGTPSFGIEGPWLPVTNCLTDAMAFPTPRRVLGLSSTSSGPASASAVLDPLTACEHFCFCAAQRWQRPGLPIGPKHLRLARTQRSHYKKNISKGTKMMRPTYRSTLLFIAWVGTFLPFS